MAGIPQKHDPGGKVRLAIPRDVKSSSAVFGGPNKCYRYQLRRTWDKTKPHAMFIMMNPSYANLKEDDRSVAKCYRVHIVHGGNRIQTDDRPPSPASRAYIVTKTLR